MMNRKSGNGLMNNIDDKIRVFNEFCNKAEERGLKILDKEKMIEEFMKHESKIYGFDCDGENFAISYNLYLDEIISGTVIENEVS